MDIEIINNKLREEIKLLSDTLNEAPVCKDKFYFIHQNYNFLENHIRNLCIFKEGSAACGYKSRYVLKMYLEYCITNKLSDFNLGENAESYSIPNFGDSQMWINYCNSLYRLYYGYTEEYFKAYNSLIQCEIRK